MKRHTREWAAGMLVAIFAILAAACLPKGVPDRRDDRTKNATPTPTASPAATIPPAVAPAPSATPAPSPTAAAETEVQAEQEVFYRKKLDGRVVGVVDGDTVDVLDDQNVTYRIRLAGIDAPEKSQPFGSRSKSNLSDLAFGKRVTVVYKKVDRYGRIVGKIMVERTDVCLRQVQDGMAWHYKRYAHEQPEHDRTSYSQAEQSAREAGIGLWADPNPQPPWERRRR